MNILAVKVPHFEDLEKALWLDRLCNGLLSQAKFRGFLTRESEAPPLIWLRPSYSAVDVAFVWTEKKAFPWKTVGAVSSEDTTVYWEGIFTSKELEEGKEVLGCELQKWPQREADI